jgi:putative SOS response-associated peptidase YedK
MCGRYVVIEKLAAYESRFNAVTKQTDIQCLPNYNVSPGNFAPIITGDKPHEIQFFRFGFTPRWATKPMYLINARSEGDNNREDNPDYHGAKGIITKPAFRQAIRSQRCLVLADYFIEGSVVEKLKKPYLVYLKRRPFAMAGIWDEWVNKETGEIIQSFAIITTPANSLLRRIPHHRSPLILSPSDEQRWLKAEHLNEVTAMLEIPLAEDMNAYPISADIRDPKSHDISILQPIGAPLLQDVELQVVRDLKMMGMGEGKRDQRTLFDN